MARMIPPQYDQSTVSAAEKRIFHLLENDPDTTDWYALHSLGLSSTSRGPYGEIDFVILLPIGAVICLEVKGGRVGCKNGVWETTDSFGVTSPLKKSPFMQAREGMFALRKAVEEKFGIASDASRCLFACAVVFPGVDCPPKTAEFSAWEAIDRHALLKTPISKLVLNVLSGQRSKVRGYQPPSAPATCIRDIRQFLRPDFDRIVARPTVINECEASLISLTQDQYSVLDMISENPRCLIEGAAGTGKTVLAFEYARRQAAKGFRVLLLCFNRLLGEWFESVAEMADKSTLSATSYFRFVRELIVKSEWKIEFEAAEQNASQNELFSELLPLYGQLAAEALTHQYDVMVLDEAQDLLRPDTVSLLGTLLRGGIAGGKWYVFGDFTTLLDNVSMETRLGSHVCKR